MRGCWGKLTFTQTGMSIKSKFCIWGMHGKEEGGRGKKGLMGGYKGWNAPWGGKERGRRTERKSKEEEHEDRIFRNGALGVKPTCCVIVWTSKICHHDVLNTATCCPLQWGFKCPHSLPMISLCVSVCLCMYVHMRACAWQQMLVQWRNPTSPGKSGREMLPRKRERERERERKRGEGGRDGARRKRERKRKRAACWMPSSLVLEWCCVEQAGRGKNTALLRHSIL